MVNVGVNKRFLLNSPHGLLFRVRVSNSGKSANTQRKLLYKIEYSIHYKLLALILICCQ